MILTDSSVWIDHLRTGSPQLRKLLDDDAILMHPWIRGELSLGSIHERTHFIAYLALLPQIPAARDEEIFELIEAHRLFARGIGWVDAGLLASCLAYPCRLWTLDGRLSRIAAELGVGVGTPA